jgi:hypothetical protein
VLDADALAHETILERTLGYFEEPAVAFVQTPQVFCNVDAFEVNYDPVRRTYWSASDLFHFDLQRGFAHLNAALCVGSGFVFRRSAVLAVGGFTTKWAGEDVHLSMDLHMKGWRSQYVDEVLAFHLAPDGLGQYWTQHVRWARGTQHLLERLFQARNLSPYQWMAYGQVASGYLLELLRVVFRMVPAITVVSGFAFLGPGFQNDKLFLSVYILWLLSAYIVPTLLSKGRMRPTIRNAFTLLRAGPALAAILARVAGHRFRFVVTPKGAGARAPLRAYFFPIAGITVGGSAGILAASRMLVKGDFGQLPLAFFNLEFFALGLMALWIVRDRAVSRDVDTVVVQRRGILEIDGQSGTKNSIDIDIVRLGVNKAIAVGPPDVHEGTGVLSFALDDGEYKLRGTLRRIPNRILPRIQADRACYDFAFTLSVADRDRLTDQIDGREPWRFVGSLRNYPYKFPPGIGHTDIAMAYYPLRPRIPSFRF